MLSSWLPAVMALAATAGAAGLPRAIVTLTTVTVTNTAPWPTDFTPSPIPLPTFSNPISIIDPTTSVCGQISICVDKLKTCGTTAVLTYGGCYLACSPMPTFVPPPCPTPDLSLSLSFTTVTVPTTGAWPSEVPGFPAPQPSEIPGFPAPQPSEIPGFPAPQPSEIPGFPAPQPSEIPGFPVPQPTVVVPDYV